MQKIPIRKNHVQGLSILVMLLIAALVFSGCNQVQQKPVPQEQGQTLIPKESSIGFSQVDIDELPQTVQKIAAVTEDVPIVTWVCDNNDCYILLNTNQETKDFKISRVLQRVPAQDFVWLNVQLEYLMVAAKDNINDGDGDNSTMNPKNKVIAVKLDNIGKDINGVSFEFIKGLELNPTQTVTPTPSTNTKTPDVQPNTMPDDPLTETPKMNNTPRESINESNDIEGSTLQEVPARD